MADTDRDLLLGLLALQNGLIDQTQLADGVRAWAADKDQTLVDHLVTLGHLEKGRRPAVEAIAEIHLRAHNGQTERSLAAISPDPRARVLLAEVGDTGIEQTLTQVGSAVQEGSDETVHFSANMAKARGDRFRILRPHARGGLGAVFVALDAELHREVALKQILEKHADDPVSRARFLLEAEITGGLEHPGIVPVYGLGTYADGRPYYAMRFIKGDSLKEAIDALPRRRGRCRSTTPAARSLELRQAAAAVHSTSATRSTTPTAAACSTATSSRPTSSWASTARPWSSTGDWPRRRARSDPGADLGEQTLVPASASGSAETLPGRAHGDAGLHEPRAGRGRSRTRWARGPTSTAWARRSTAC